MNNFLNNNPEKIYEQKLNVPWFVDDIAGISKNNKDLQQMLERYNVKQNKYKNKCKKNPKFLCTIDKGKNTEMFTKNHYT